MTAVTASVPSNFCTWSVACNSTIDARWHPDVLPSHEETALCNQGTNTIPSMQENMGHSSSERGDLDFEMDLPEAAENGEFHSAAQQEPAGHAAQRQPLTELGSAKQSRPGSGGSHGDGAGAANLGGSHLSKGSWANLGAIGDGANPGSAVEVGANGDLSDAEDLYS